jgi:starch synthase
LRTLEAAPDFNAPVVMIPYGAPPPIAPAAVVKPASPRLRVLFVGSLGQRKGLSYLFAACRQLGAAVELTVIGQKPSAPCAALERELRGVRWIPTCAHAGVLAMGLPIITTAHTAGPDLIREGVEGFIVPIRSSAAIAACLETLHREPSRLAEMSAQARLRAREFTWSAYESTLALCVAQALAKV